MALSRVQALASQTYTQASTAFTSHTSASITAATAGQLLLFMVGIDKSSGTITGPAGWTQIANQPGTSISMGIWGKIATGGETSATCTWTTGGAGASSIIAVYNGASSTGWQGAAHVPAYSDTATTSLVLDPPAASAAGLCLAFLCNDSVTNFAPTATGFSLVTSLAGTGQGWPGVALLEANTGVVNGTDLPATTFTSTDSDQTQGATFLVYEAAANQNWTANPADGAGAVDALPLLPPDGLTATPASTTQLDLRWALTAGADAGYDIERDGAVIVTGRTVPTYSDTGLTPATSHSYRVRSARNVSG